MRININQFSVVFSMVCIVAGLIGSLVLLSPEYVRAQTETETAETAAPQAGTAPMSSPGWSPYAVGIGVGILSMIVFVFSDTSIGASTAYARAAGMIEKRIWGAGIENKPFYQKITPTVDWQVMFVGGILIGAFLSALLSGEFRISFLPSVWQEGFGNTPLLRLLAALLGGLLMGFGARWAGGCTSGHGISGALQLATGSWLAIVCFFAGGIVVAHLIY